MKLKFVVFILFGIFSFFNTRAQAPKFKFDNQSDNVEVSVSTVAKVNIVCSNNLEYRIRLIPDENIGKVHMRLIAPKENKVLYDNAKDGYKLTKILKLEKSMVIMLEASLVMTEDDEDNPDFVSHGWIAMLVQNRPKQ